jgi:hypothetical protein
VLACPGSRASSGSSPAGLGGARAFRDGRLVRPAPGAQFEPARVRIRKYMSAEGANWGPSPAYDLRSGGPDVTSLEVR